MTGRWACTHEPVDVAAARPMSAARLAGNPQDLDEDTETKKVNDRAHV